MKTLVSFLIMVVMTTSMALANNSNNSKGGNGKFHAKYERAIKTYTTKSTVEKNFTRKHYRHHMKKKR